MEMTDRQLVQSILSRITATAAEHAALQHAFSGWKEGYDRGYKDALDKAKSQAEGDADLLKLARAYVDGCPVDRDFSDLNAEKDKTWTYKAIAKRLKQLHVTPQDLDAIRTELTEVE